MPRPAPSSPQLGTTIRELRTKRNLTIEDLAAEANVHPTYLSRIELKKCNPSWEKVRALAEALQVDASKLIRLAETLAASERRQA